MIFVPDVVQRIPTVIIFEELFLNLVFGGLKEKAYLDTLFCRYIKATEYMSALKAQNEHTLMQMKSSTRGIFVKEHLSMQPKFSA